MVLKFKMKKNILLVLVLVGMNVWAKAQQVTQLQSPDKFIVLNVFLSAKGEMQYRIQKSGVDVIQPSALGVMDVKEFLRTLPNNRDDVKFVEDYPGKYAVIARRSGNRWYMPV